MHAQILITSRYVNEDSPLCSDSSVVFPKELYIYGLDEELLTLVFDQVQSEKEKKPLRWCLQGVPNNDFYQILHPFLKKWPKSRLTTKVAIGKFYIAIDRNLREKGCRPDNVYRFVERVANTGHPDELVTYDRGITELKAMQSEVTRCTEYVTNLGTQVCELKQQLEESKKQLHSARCALRDVTNEKFVLKEQLKGRQRSFKNFVSHWRKILCTC